jgi:hypothetical protein
MSRVAAHLALTRITTAFSRGHILSPLTRLVRQMKLLPAAPLYRAPLQANEFFSVHCSFLSRFTHSHSPEQLSPAEERSRV